LLKLPEKPGDMKDTLQQEKEFTINSVSEPNDIENVIYSLMVNPNLSSINYFNDFSETGILPESIGDGDNDELGLFDIDTTGASMALSTHAFHHHLQNDPKKATEILISRATRKMHCLGAQPVAISAFLYHIDFADPNGQYIASGAKKGLENAAQKFGLKISDRKIRFDHFSGHGPVPPTIIISLVGLVEDRNKITTHAFKQKGGNIFLIGRSVDDIGSSEYLEFYHGISDSPLPAFDIDDEFNIQHALSGLHRMQLLESASPVGKGGLFFTLLRAAVPNGLGFDITTDAETRIDSFLFGESMGRILLEVKPEKEDDFVDFMTGRKIPFFTLGHITRGEIRIDDKSLGYINKMTTGV
jgi:phosphoribosylformylglycinamidine synthase subunit PurL